MTWNYTYEKHPLHRKFMTKCNKDNRLLHQISTKVLNSNVNKGVSLSLDN